MKRSFYGLTGIALLICGEVSAAVINTGLPSGAVGESPFGEGNTATYGQTFTVVGTDTVLDSLTFWMDDFLNPDVVDFAAYVMAWNGSRATGPVLYQSVMHSTTNNGGAGGMERFDFDTGGVQLTSGQQYVAFLNTSGFFDGQQGTAGWGLNGETYSGGSFVFTNNGSDFSLLTSQDWDYPGSGIGDTPFLASLSAPAAVPEPGSLAIWSLMIGGVGVANLRKRRKAIAA